jgi:hypothetical protein
MRCLGRLGRNDAIGCLAGGSTIVALAVATYRAMRVAFNLIDRRSADDRVPGAG